MKPRTQEKTWDRLHIQLLDRFEIVQGDKSVDQALRKTKKGKTLVCALILHRGRPVPYEVLHDALWSQGESRDLDNVLKVLVSRTRAILAEVDPSLRDCIVGQKGTYRWNMDITAEVDVFSIEALCRELKEAKEISSGMLERLETLMCLYTGKLLPEESQIPWIRNMAEELEWQYKQTVTHSLMLLRAKRDWKAVMKVCRMGLMRLPEETQWHEEMMQALVTANEADAVPSGLLDGEPQADDDMRPSAEILKLYSDIQRSGGALDEDMDTISRELIACQDKISGVQMCEYATFKYVYEQQLRSADRSGIPHVAAILKVNNVLEGEIQPLVLEDVMNRLGKVLKESLRKSDTVARYSSSQFAILLQDPAAGAVKRILERIRLAFYREINNMDILLDYRFRPLVTDNEEFRMKVL